MKSTTSAGYQGSIEYKCFSSATKEKPSERGSSHKRKSSISILVEDLSTLKVYKDIK